MKQACVNIPEQRVHGDPGLNKHCRLYWHSPSIHECEEGCGQSTVFPWISFCQFHFQGTIFSACWLTRLCSNCWIILEKDLQSCQRLCRWRCVPELIIVQNWQKFWIKIGLGTSHQVLSCSCCFNVVPLFHLQQKECVYGNITNIFKGLSASDHITAPVCRRLHLEINCVCNSNNRVALSLHATNQRLTPVIMCRFYEDKSL